MTHDQLNQRINEIKDIQDKKQDKFYSWIKHLITISIGLFGILISFKSDLPMSCIKSILFVFSITSLGLGILFGLIVLYSEVHLLGRLKSKTIQYTVKELDGENLGTAFDTITVSYFYKIAHFLCFFFYIISLFSLIGYSTCDLII